MPALLILQILLRFQQSIYKTCKPTLSVLVGQLVANKETESFNAMIDGANSLEPEGLGDQNRWSAYCTVKRR